MSASKRTISAAEFGAKPENKNNATELRNAVIACRGRKGVTLVIAPGVYHFRDEQAVELRDEVISGGFGPAFERFMFYPYAPYVKGLDFSSCDGVTVQAEGVTLLCEGWMEPVSLDRCKNVTIRGLSIDYLPKPFSVGKIVAQDGKSCDVEIDPAYPITQGTQMSRTLFWNVTANHLVRHVLWPGKEYLGPQKVKLTGQPPTEPGEILAMITHTLHFRPAILINEAENITLDHVTIHAQPGMGIVGNRGHNITLDHLQVIPSPDLHFSTNTDATHFTACTGTLLFDHCRIEGQADDSTNIHGYYQTIVQVIEETKDSVKVKLRVDAPTGTHAQVLDYPDAGDELELVELDTLKPVQTFKVTSVQPFPQDWNCVVTLAGKLPKDIDRYMIADITRMPRVIIRNSHFINNAGRILIKSRNVLIENNVIEDVLGSGVFVGAEASWKEGFTSTDVVVRGNTLQNCGAGITVVLDAKDKTAVGVHKRIVIENNLIDGYPASDGILVTNAEDVTIRGNIIAGCKPGIKIMHSRRIHVGNNPGGQVEVGPGVSDLHEGAY
nr:right-handed parallel beta-helix repeat-containing protein [Candidatus Sigynarchaeum springense]